MKAWVAWGAIVAILPSPRSSCSCSASAIDTPVDDYGLSACGGVVFAVAALAFGSVRALVVGGRPELTGSAGSSAARRAAFGRSARSANSTLVPAMYALETRPGRAATRYLGGLVCVVNLRYRLVSSCCRFYISAVPDWSPAVAALASGRLAWLLQVGGTVLTKPFAPGPLEALFLFGYQSAGSVGVAAGLAPSGWRPVHISCCLARLPCR